MMDTADERQAFRKRLVDLDNVELTQWAYLVGLAQRIDTELLAYHALFSAPSIELDPAPSTELAGIQLLITQEIRRRSVAKTKLHTLHIEGENDHANGHTNTRTQEH